VKAESSGWIEEGVRISVYSKKKGRKHEIRRADITKSKDVYGKTDRSLSEDGGPPWWWV